MIKTDLLDEGRVRTVMSGIRAYADAYAAFEELQKQHRDLLQVGDQKTGVIGEFYSLLYARWKYPGARITLSTNPSDYMGDIVVAENGNSTRIQVKTNSAHSTTRKIQFRKPPCAELLYLLSLNTALQPEGFWIVESAAEKLGGLPRLCITVAGGKRKGSKNGITWKDDRITELQSVLSRYGSLRP